MSPNRSYVDEQDLPTRSYAEPRATADREISLGTPTILAIFFALALVCAGFFGFGYTMGHRSALGAAAALPAPVEPDSGALVATPKPSAGSLAAAPAAASAQSAQTTAVQADSDPPQTATVQLTPPAGAKSTVAPSDRIIAGDKLSVATAAPAVPPQAAGGSLVVQVAAVSTQDIADIEVAALKKQGFDVQVRHEPQDKLLHVQIGPFADRKDAEAMRTRVLAAGFNAIIK